ncbi:hypothetical protein AX17_005885, partial [Amanita inopinata Kibby_2008]
MVSVAKGKLEYSSEEDEVQGAKEGKVVDWQRWRLGAVRDGVGVAGFQLGDVEDRMDGAEMLGELES